MKHYEYTCPKCGFVLQEKEWAYKPLLDLCPKCKEIMIIDFIEKKKAHSGL